MGSCRRDRGAARGLVRSPRSARPCGSVVDLGPGHDARRVARLTQFFTSRLLPGEPSRRPRRGRRIQGAPIEQTEAVQNSGEGKPFTNASRPLVHVVPDPARRSRRSSLGRVGASAVGIKEARAGRVRVPRSARLRGAVVVLGPDHDAAPSRRARAFAALAVAQFEPSVVGSRKRERRREQGAASLNVCPRWEPCLGFADVRWYFYAQPTSPPWTDR